MSDPKYIYLQPECCADPCVGRLWCEDDCPEDCEDGNAWTKYEISPKQAAIHELVEALGLTCQYRGCVGPHVLATSGTQLQCENCVKKYHLRAKYKEQPNDR